MRLVKLFFLLMLLSFTAQADVLTSYETGQDANLEIGCGGGGCASRERLGAMSFQLSADATVESVELYLQLNSGAGDISVRIETDSSGVPSTTLADADGTCTIASASVPGSYAFTTCTFSSSFDLVASTSYWIVARRASGDSGGADENYLWGADSSSPSYADGVGKQSDNDFSTGGNWSGTSDALFKVNGTAAGGDVFTPKITWFN